QRRVPEDGAAGERARRPPRRPAHELDAFPEDEDREEEQRERDRLAATAGGGARLGGTGRAAGGDRGRHRLVPHRLVRDLQGAVNDREALAQLLPGDAERRGGVGYGV